MSTRLATQRNFLLASNTAAASAAATATITATATTSNNDKNNSIVADEIVVGSIATGTNRAATTATTLCENDVKNEELITNPSSCSSSHQEEYELFDCNGTFVTTADLETVMTQKKMLNGNQATEEVAVIVVPMDASDSSNDANGSIQTISAIKEGDLAQHVAGGQVTVVQTTETDDDKPQFITVTVSAQDAGQNYQVQYVDSEIYHNSAGQTQMTYPFCPVGDYQTNGQTYYSTAVASSGNYSTSTSGNTSSTHATALPYLVPVEDSILLNSSSQSQSRDSPHSLEAVYIHEAQSTPQTPTSTTTTNSVSGGSIGSGGGGASPESEQNALGNTNKIASATIMWLSRNYETADGVSLPRSTLYNHYIQHCNENKLEPVNAASFGKLIRSVFSGLRTRRLGTRGNSKYHYYGIRIKPGSPLSQVPMDDKSAVGNYHSHSNENSSSVGGAANGSSTSSNNVVAGNNSGGGGGGTHSSRGGNKKLGYKETYEACAQFLGNGVGAIPTFPHIELDSTFSSELTADDVETFRAMYREHCESFLDAVLSLEFSTIEFLWRDFWRATDNNNLDECEEEKFLSKTKLYLLCHCAEVQKFVKEVDYQFYQNMVDVIIPDVLRSIPNALTQAIRTFSKNLEIWLCKSMAGIPERLVQIKKSAISAFCQTLRRYTSLNHLAQAARAVLQNSSQIAQMLNDLNRVDFHNIQEQASWVCQCDPAMVQRVENDFKSALQQQITLEQWASWLQMVVESVLDEYRGKPSFVNAARQFLLNWNFYSTMVIRDLTLRSASSFGSFHLIRLLYDEYMFYLVEHKIAEAQQKSVIAVICDRKQKFIDMEFEYQLDMMNDSNNDDAGSVPKHMKLE